MRKLISLGHDCDVAFQLRMHGEENVAHFFDWLSTPVDGIVQILNADFDVFYADHLSLDTSSTPHHVVDRMTKVKFFHQFPLHNGNVLPNFLMFYDGFIRKFTALAERFRHYVTSGPVTLVRQAIVEAEALALEAAFFARFPGADARFLYIVEPNQHFVTTHGTTRSIKPEGSLGEPIAWWAALQDEGLIGPAFRHSTIEILQHQADDHSLSVVDRFTEVQLQTAAAVHSDHGKFPLELARFYARRQRWDKAEEMARLALARSPGLPNAVFELNFINWKAKKISPDDAATAFAMFLKTEVHDPIWLTETCAALLDAGRLEEAAACSDKAVMATPMDSEAHYHRAMCFLRLNKLDRADYAITTALSLRQHPYLHHTHSVILAELRRWDDAVAAAKVACSLDGGVFYINHLASLLLRAAEPKAPTPAPALAAAATVVVSVPPPAHVAAVAAPLHVSMPVIEEAKAEAMPAETVPDSPAASDPAWHDDGSSTLHQFMTAEHEAESFEAVDADDVTPPAVIEAEVAIALTESAAPHKRPVVGDPQAKQEDVAAPMRFLTPLRA